VSLKVLVVPEDPTNNGYILRPLIYRMMQQCGKPNAKVTMLTNPRATGYDSAKQLLAGQVFERYVHFDLLLFLPDADGKDRSAEFARLEEQASGRNLRLLCCAAVQEVEAWLLAGHVEKLEVSWPQIRKDVSVKENAFAPFLDRYGDRRRAGGGRDVLMAKTLRNYNGILQRCPELADLEERVKRVLGVV